MFELFDKYVVKPQEEQQAQMLPAMAGMGLQAGAPMGALPQGPQGPVQAAPQGADLLARIGSPAGPGGMIGADVRG